MADNPNPNADTVRCSASISGSCLQLTQGFGLCEENECELGDWHCTDLCDHAAGVYQCEQIDGNQRHD